MWKCDIGIWMFFWVNLKRNKLRQNFTAAESVTAFDADILWPMLLGVQLFFCFCAWAEGAVAVVALWVIMGRCGGGIWLLYVRVYVCQCCGDCCCQCCAFMFHVTWNAFWFRCCRYWRCCCGCSGCFKRKWCGVVEGTTVEDDVYVGAVDDGKVLLLFMLSYVVVLPWALQFLVLLPWVI